MRRAGALPDTNEAARFVAYLATLGIRAQADPGADGHDVWVWDDDHLVRACDELERFRADPADVRYATPERAPEAPGLPRRSVLQSLRDNPLTAALAVTAILVTGTWMSGRSIDRLVTDYHTFPGEPWRLISSIFPHAGIFHLIFNVLWLWALGSRMESVFGTARYAAAILLFAAASSCAEFAFSLAGGVGLSGVVYGLFGFLWIAARRDRRFAGAIGRQTAALLIGWFFLCIVLTETGAMNVANVAHGAGAVSGILLAWTVGARRRWIPASALAALILSTLAAATWARPIVNPRAAAMERWQRARETYLAGNLQRALRMVEGHPPYPAHLLIESGDYAAARGLYEDYVRDESAPRTDPNRNIAHYNLACIYSLLSVGKEGPKAEPISTPSPEEAAGWRDRAFDHFGRAVASGFSDFAHARTDPDLEPLRADDRWTVTVDK